MAVLLFFQAAFWTIKISHKNFEQAVLMGESISTKNETIKVCHALLQNPKFLSLLLQIDTELAAQMRSRRCPCGGALHRADYPRKPRACPKEVRPAFGSRLSFCCGQCRKRATCASVRFLGRRVYLGIVVLLASIRRAKHSAAALGVVQMLAVPERTIARLRFCIIGPLLAAPPKSGELQSELARLGARVWRHPLSGLDITFAPVTVERWYYVARRANDPVAALRNRVRGDINYFPSLNQAVIDALVQQYREHPGWSMKLHFDNLCAAFKDRPDTVASYTKTIRPPAYFTNSLKCRQIAEYGYKDTNPRDYEEDYLVRSLSEVRPKTRITFDRQRNRLLQLRDPGFAHVLTPCVHCNRVLCDRHQ